jgi:diphthamide synthase (EF-2-diphthine--ammonia ligase)
VWREIPGEQGGWESLMIAKPVYSKRNSGREEESRWRGTEGEVVSSKSRLLKAGQQEGPN